MTKRQRAALKLAAQQTENIECPQCGFRWELKSEYALKLEKRIAELEVEIERLRPRWEGIPER
jgi:DNA-directed RNA polymerase subunit RPC12/RpoP